ncbi:aldehyde dehydrogenase family protein [Streptomyces thioluteus]|uniref:aldehyde dehydrogenase family protein n=1 Tax=Streptomyces thioluteus TaxID=66431 RepID=UPI0031EB0F71
MRAVHDPGRLDEVVAEVTVGTADDVDHAVRSAHEAFLTWRDVPAIERARKLLAAADVLSGISRRTGPATRPRARGRRTGGADGLRARRRIRAAHRGRWPRSS